MEITTLCAVFASFQVLPDRSQFFQYESVAFSLNCDQQEDAAVWTIKRNTSKQISSLCPSYTTDRHESTCFLSELYEMDSGVYWCESEAGKISNTISITVTGGELILEIPALPVMEGDEVVLRCRTREKLSGNNSSTFYKDKLFIGSSVRGSITLQRVSKYDEGNYRCHMSGVGESPDSFLTVRGFPESPPSLHGDIVLPVMVTGVSLFLLMFLCLWRNHPDSYDSSTVLYTGGINRRTQRAKVSDDLQRGRCSETSTVVVYRPVLRPVLRPVPRPVLRPVPGPVPSHVLRSAFSSAGVRTYKAYREFRTKQQIFPSLQNKSVALSPANDYN
ncbi:PREDICTED: low affinity immunoglobulin gamma Fc region receptor II-a-like isoform X2 [Poecilia mexicana]|uniref:low affinity immunoglobulin gamma Fc region receptor II-a-like isoform X2 n=1 Tax=Poecilia mexicana TaxID=48701 RepID=UPI00072EA1FE|nr:PREDICTED: low affinity immunoglobulin gamma Fc region receptor II-a-like isoform X2 [Poecilia mexicana]